ncbi:MAG TPA: hypothetical protein VMW67_06830 [Desulfobacteria bacterium]|nr:hypothetical protein [Desulfobacteria bacterium]
MKSFSQREGLKPIKTVIQVDSMDEDLRNALWNVLSVFYWDRVKIGWISDPKVTLVFFRRLWMSYFKRPFDTLEDHFKTTYNTIREYYFCCQWFEVYDFIEFVAESSPYDAKRINENFMEFCNKILERELSAYRFVGGKITQMTSEDEISEVEEALQVPISPVNEHLHRALELLAIEKIQIIGTQLKRLLVL